MNEAKNKACPFCGRQARVICNGYPVAGKFIDWVSVCCPATEGGCGASQADTTEEKAWQRWNTRAGDQQPEAAPNAEAIASSLERVVRRTPITDKNANGNVVSAELARTLEVMCQELATELEVEMNPGYSCQPLREWKSMQPAPNGELTDAGPVTPDSRETQSRHSVQ